MVGKRLGRVSEGKLGMGKGLDGLESETKNWEGVRNGWGVTKRCGKGFKGLESEIKGWGKLGRKRKG